MRAPEKKGSDAVNSVSIQNTFTEYANSIYIKRKNRTRFLCDILFHSSLCSNIGFLVYKSHRITACFFG